MGRVTGHKQTTDGHEYTTAYAYNLSGGLLEETYPSGRKVRNTIDANGDLSKVESRRTIAGGYWTYASNFTYNAAGAVTALRLGNGDWESTGYNGRLQPEHINLGTTPGATNLLKLDYSYGDWGAGGTIDASKNNGNIIQQVITVPDVGSTSGFVATQKFYYDSLNRIHDATETVGSSQTWRQDFTYDRWGNRNFVEANTTTIPRNCSGAICALDHKIYNPSVNTADNKLSSSEGYRYDNRGNTTGDPQDRTFKYDSENKQVEVRNSSNAVVGQYVYDGDRKRVKKIVPEGETTIFVYDAMGKQLAEYSNQVLPVEDAKVAYLTADHLGSPRINTDRDGNVTARHDYHPFGEEILTVATGQRVAALGYDSDWVRKKFTGYERDEETGLDLAGVRYFAMRNGRFTTPDAFANANIADVQTLNLYAYVINCPTRFTDPYGKDIWMNINGNHVQYVRTGNEGVFLDADGNRTDIGSETLGVINNLYANTTLTGTIDNLLKDGSHNFEINESGDLPPGNSVNVPSITNQSNSFSILTVNTSTEAATGESSVSMGVELKTADWLQINPIDAPYAYSMTGCEQWNDYAIGTYTNYEEMRLGTEADLRTQLGVNPEASTFPVPVNVAGRNMNSPEPLSGFGLQPDARPKCPEEPIPPPPPPRPRPSPGP